MKVAIIGSNSFSGSHFVNLLLENTHYAVLGISRSPEKSELYLPYKKRDLSKFKFYQLDLNKNCLELLALFDEEKPKYIVNFASQSMVGQSWDNPDHWYNTNVLSIVKLTNELKERDYLTKYVHISTPEVYGNCTGIVRENNIFNPSTPYAGSRAAADNFIQMLVKQFNFPAVFTRAANVYGPHQQLFKIIPKAVVCIKKGETIPLHGGGFAKRSFIHIKDVCEATLKIMENSEPGEIYHLSTNKLVSIRDLVKLITDKKKICLKNSIMAVETRRGLDDAYILDSTKANQELSWTPKINLEDGIEEVMNWVDYNWEKIKKERGEYIHEE